MADIVNTSPVKREEERKDGMYLIIEPGYSIETLRSFIKESCLSEKFDFLYTTTNIKEICRKLIAFLDSQVLNLDEISTMFVVACMCYYVDKNPGTIDWCSQLLQRTFQHVDTLSPMHLHICTKRLWQALKTDNIDYAFNILTLCRQISFASETGRAIAICLMWTILFQITETDVEMYRFHEFSVLIKTLNELDDSLLRKEENIRIVYILVQCIGFLMNTIVFGKNDDFKNVGYRKYFSYSKRDLEKLQKYVESLSSLLNVQISADNNFELRMTITEYLNCNIIAVLQEKISEIKGSK